MIEETMCPVCFDIESEHIYDVRIKNSNGSRPLHKCRKCGGFFWDDTGERIQLLSRLCETRWLNRKKCNEAVLNFYPGHTPESSVEKTIKALDKICCGCPNKKFILP